MPSRHMPRRAQHDPARTVRCRLIHCGWALACPQQTVAVGQRPPFATRQQQQGPPCCAKASPVPAEPQRPQILGCSGPESLQLCCRSSSLTDSTSRKMTMISRFNALAAVLLAASLAACSQTSMAPPMSGNSNASSQAPQPSNSLPEGSAVNAPLTNSTGVVGETQVAPTPSIRRPARRVRRPVHRRPRMARPATPVAPAAPAGTTPQ